MENIYYVVSCTKPANGISNIYTYNYPYIIPLEGIELAEAHKSILYIENDIIQYLNKSLFNCFNIHYEYTNFASLTPTDNLEYYLVIRHNKTSNTVNLIFSMSFIYNMTIQEPKLELWNVCRSDYEAGDNFRVYNFIRTMVKAIMDFTGINTVWLGVLFTNPYYKKAIESYLKAGFNIKNVTTHSLQYTPDLYNRVLVMEAYNNKGLFTDLSINLSKERVDELLVIATRIQMVESGSIKKTNVVFDPSGWKLLLQKIISKNTECAGIIKEIPLYDGSKVVTANEILLGCEGTTCATTQLFEYEINFHTHPIACYIEYHGENSFISPPSNTDLASIFFQSTKILKYHCVASLEGIYVIQIHPYWKTQLKFFNKMCVEVLYTILKEIDYPDYYFTDIIGALQWLNNSFSPNELIKNRLKHEKNPEFIRKLHALKESCISEDINRNINLYMCSFVQWPLNDPILAISDTLNMYMYQMKAIKIEIESSTLDFKKQYISSLLSTGFRNENITIPFYEFNH